MQGNVLLPPNYKDIRGLTTSPKTVSVKAQDGKVSIMAIEGSSMRKITSFKYDFAVMDGDQIKVKIGDKFGYVTTSGTENWQ